MIFIRGQESCSFLFPVLGSLGASLLAEEASGEEAQAVVVSVVGEDRMSAAGCRGSQPGQPGRPERSRRGQRIHPLRRWWPPPLPRPHLPGRWWAVLVVGSSRGFSLFGCRI